MPSIISLYDAKTRLSGLVDQAAAGEEIIISKNGVPYAKLVPIRFRGEMRKPANAMKITHLAADFDAPEEAMIRLFEGQR
jgi:prevent-host-death family protein